MTAPRPRSRQPKQLDAGMFQAEINSFALRLAAEGKAAKTIRTYTEAVQWFAATGPPVPASLQPHLAGPRRPRRRPDGTQRLVLAPDAPPLRRQRPQRPRPPHLRPHHDRHLRPPPWPLAPTASHSGRAANLPLGAGPEVPERPPGQAAEGPGWPHRNPTRSRSIAGLLSRTRGDQSDRCLAGYRLHPPWCANQPSCPPKTSAASPMPATPGAARAPASNRLRTSPASGRGACPASAPRRILTRSAATLTCSYPASASAASPSRAMGNRWTRRSAG